MITNSTYIGCFAFSIPAVTSIVSHFIRHVLSKSKLVWIDTNFRHKQINPCHEVAQSFVCYKTLTHKNSHVKFNYRYLVS